MTIFIIIKEFPENKKLVMNLLSIHKLCKQVCHTYIPHPNNVSSCDLQVPEVGLITHLPKPRRVHQTIHNHRKLFELFTYNGDKKDRIFFIFLFDNDFSRVTCQNPVTI